MLITEWSIEDEKAASFKEGREEGHEEGREEGHEEEREVTVKKLLKAGMDVPYIANVLELPLDMVEQYFVSAE